MPEDARTRLFGAPNANHLWARLVIEALVRDSEFFGQVVVHGVVEREKTALL